MMPGRLAHVACVPTLADTFPTQRSQQRSARGSGSNVVTETKPRAFVAAELFDCPSRVTAWYSMARTQHFAPVILLRIAALATMR